MTNKHGNKPAARPSVPPDLVGKTKGQLDALESNLNDHIELLTHLIKETGDGDDKVRFSKERIQAREKLMEIYNTRAKQGI